MNETETKSPHYALIIDKKRDMIIGVLMEALSLKDFMSFFHVKLHNLGVTDDEILEFLGELADKTHEMGWCDDPECVYKGKIHD